VHLIVLGVHQDRPAVAAQKINRVRAGDEAAHRLYVRDRWLPLPSVCALGNDLEDRRGRAGAVRPVATPVGPSDSTRRKASGERAPRPLVALVIENDGNF
jgi:hypothetical protein